MPLVSIIIPTYKHARFVLQTLDSVLAQTVPASDREIIVINDGSPDDTAELLRPLCRAGTIHYIEQANAGQARARNRGLAAASGEFVAFLDDDDLWPPDKLEWQLKVMGANPDVGVVGGTLERMNEDGLVYETAGRAGEVTLDSLFRENPMFSPGQALIRRRIMLKAGPLNENVWGADDWDLWFRLVRLTRIVICDRLALRYRLHPGNASRNWARMIASSLSVAHSHLPELPPGRRAAARKAVYRLIFDGLGVPLVEQAASEFFAVRPGACLGTLGGALGLATVPLADLRRFVRTLRVMAPRDLRRRLGPWLRGARTRYGSP